MHAVSIPDSARERGRLKGLSKPIDPATTAVLAIDFQRFFIDEGQPMGNPHARDMLENANQLNAAVRDAGGLVVFTQHTSQVLHPGSSAYELHPRITVSTDDVTIIKHESSPLHPRARTSLLELLVERRIETLIITGLVTNGCCDCTARDAAQHGFNVVVASDATAAMTDEEHNGALLSLAIYYAQVLDTEAIRSALT
jgi:ureidoacrylate peracid hydrolase